MVGSVKTMWTPDGRPVFAGLIKVLAPGNIEIPHPPEFKDLNPRGLGRRPIHCSNVLPNVTLDLQRDFSCADWHFGWSHKQRAPYCWKSSHSAYLAFLLAETKWSASALTVLQGSAALSYLLIALSQRAGPYLGTEYTDSFACPALISAHAKGFLFTEDVITITLRVVAPVCLLSSCCSAQ